MSNGWSGVDLGIEGVYAEVWWTSTDSGWHVLEQTAPSSMAAAAVPAAATW